MLTWKAVTVDFLVPVYAVFASNQIRVYTSKIFSEFDTFSISLQELF